MYRGSIPPNIFWRCCAPLYIAKLQDKASCRLNTRLQKEFTRENIKLKISGKSVVRAWRNKGNLARGKMKGPNFARWFFMVRNGQISHHEENLLVKWCSHGLMQLSSEGHIFLISTPNHARFEVLDSWLPEIWNGIYYVKNGLREVLQKCERRLQLRSSIFLFSIVLSLHTLNDFGKGLWSSKAWFFMNLSFQKLFHNFSK